MEEKTMIYISIVAVVLGGALIFGFIIEDKTMIQQIEGDYDAATGCNVKNQQCIDEKTTVDIPMNKGFEWRIKKSSWDCFNNISEEHFICIRG